MNTSQGNKIVSNGNSCFLKDVAKYLFQSSKGDLSQTIVIFPNRRARLFFNRYLSDLAENPVWAPQYFTISDFIRKISGLQLADQLTLIFKLFKLYKEITKSKESFDEFYFFCETVLSDFDDIDKYLADAKLLFRNLSHLKSVEDYREYLTEEQEELIRQFWELFARYKPSEEMSEFISFWNALSDIYVRFNEVLDEEGIAYEGKSYRKAIEVLDSGPAVPFQDKRIVFVGFNALNRSEEILFKRFRSRGNTLFFWDFDKSYTDNEIHEAGFFLRKYLKTFPQPADFVTKAESNQKEVRITTVSVPSNISQAKIIHDFFLPGETDRIGHPSGAALVLADEKLLLPVISSLPSSLEEVNISMGYPVLDTPAYSFLTSLADLHAHKKTEKRSSDTIFYHKDYFSILNHPFLAEVKESEEFKAFGKKIVEENIAFIHPFQLSEYNSLYSVIFSWNGKAESFGSYLMAVITIVIQTLIASERKDNETKWQLEVLHAIEKVLVRFDQLLTNEGIELKLPTVLNLLKRILSGISVPFSGEPLTGLQILGILETRTLDFEQVVILSMNEGKFPKSSHSPSFIPYALREGFGLPTIRHQDAIYAYYFYRLLHRAKKVVLVYNTKSEGLQKGEYSRYILQLKYNPGYTLEHINYAYKVMPFQLRTIRAEKSEDALAELKKYRRPEGSSFLSPSALNIYLNCRLRFYFKYIERMEEPDNVEEDIESNVFGSILHKAVEILYSPYQGTMVNSEDLKSILKNAGSIRMAIESSFADIFFGRDKLNTDDLSGRNVIIKQVVEKYIRETVAYDMSIAPFYIHSLEKRHETICDQTAIGGVIDRLDEKDGYYRVIDYKTGKVNSKFRHIDDLFESQPSKRNNAVFQTFLYSWLLTKNGEPKKIRPALYFVRDICNSGFDWRVFLTENRKSRPVNDYSEFADDFEERLKGLIYDLFDPTVDFTQTDDTEYCLHCPYNAICSRKV